MGQTRCVVNDLANSEFGVWMFKLRFETTQTHIIFIILILFNIHQWIYFHEYGNMQCIWWQTNSTICNWTENCGGMRTTFNFKTFKIKQCTKMNDKIVVVKIKPNWNNEMIGWSLTDHLVPKLKFKSTNNWFINTLWL